MLKPPITWARLGLEPGTHPQKNGTLPKNSTQNVHLKSQEPQGATWAPASAKLKLHVCQALLRHAARWIKEHVWAPAFSRSKPIQGPHTNAKGSLQGLPFATGHNKRSS